MLLNGWKEISEYLKCSVRTAQRWAHDLALPVMRVRSGERGPVMAYSHKLDVWMDHRSSLVVNEVAQQRASTLKEQTQRQGSNFLWMELETGRQFAKLAKTSKNEAVISRRRQAARRAYDTLLYYLSRHASFSNDELNEFRKELRVLKHDLEELGEVFEK